MTANAKYVFFPRQYHREGALWVALGLEAAVLKRCDAQGRPRPRSLMLPEGSRAGCFGVDPGRPPGQEATLAALT